MEKQGEDVIQKGEEQVEKGGTVITGEQIWSRVSPEKVGRSPGVSSQENLHISVSKFAVLSVDGEDEEGEIKEPEPQTALSDSRVFKSQ